MATENYSIGLEYDVNVDEEYCTVTGIGTCIDTEIVIPDTYEGYDVREIGSRAFEYAQLTSIAIPDSVTSIGFRAFYWCTRLTSVTIGNNVTSIGSSAFSSCDSLTSVTIGDSVTSIGDNAFYNTAYYKNESNWENGVLYIGKYLIDAKTDISGAYTVKDGTKLIAECAFEYCNSLTSVTIPNSVTSIGDRAFYSCFNLTSVTIGNSVMSIGFSAFSRCDNLTSVTIPNSVRSIGESAFADCKKLTSVTIPDSVTSIGSDAFYGCKIAKATIPASAIFAIPKSTLIEAVITSGIVSDFAFSSCSNLTSVTIGSGVTSIGSEAFDGCYKLVEVINKSSLTLTKGSDSNGKVAYYALEVHSGESKIVSRKGYLFYTVDGVNYLVNYVDNDKEPTTHTDYNGENYVINDYAFYNNNKITEVTISDGVTSIGDYAFQLCESLTNVIIGNGVTSIGDGAFYYCNSLTGITMPNSVMSIGYGAFGNCESLTDITIPNSVTSIGTYAFNGCYSLTSMTIPDSVTSIGDYAFQGCYSLTSVTIPNSVNFLGRSIFQECDALTDVIISEGCTRVGPHMFYGCDMLSNVTLPSTLTTIETSAFSTCSSLRNIEIPQNTTSIEAYAFANTPLDDITLSSTNLSVGQDAFQCDGEVLVIARDVRCTGGAEAWCNITFATAGSNPLHRVDLANSSSTLYFPGKVTDWERVSEFNIPNGETHIHNNMLYGCSSVTSLTVPSTVVTIEPAAFAGCTQLQSITLDHPVNSLEGAVWGAPESVQIAWIGATGSENVEFYFLNDPNAPCPARGAISFGVQTITDSDDNTVSTGDDGILYVTDANGPHAVGTFDADKIRFTTALTFNQNFGRFRPNGVLTTFDETKGMSIQEFIQSALTD